MKKEQNRVFLGYMRNLNGEIEIHPLEMPIVNIIFQAYLDGNSLGKISKMLNEMNIPSSSGKSVWGKQIIDNLLSNEKYVGNEIYPQVVSRDLFDDVQMEKQNRRSLNNIESGSRYSSAHPLSGLLTCGECGRKYRRYTRSNGEVVWRCANRIEHGSEICKSSPALSEISLKTTLIDLLEKDYKLRDIDSFEYVVRDTIDEETADIVRMVYSLYLQGYSLAQIKAELEAKGIPSPRGNGTWARETIRKILKNEKYTGCVMLQKTFVDDYLTHKQIPNNGQRQKYTIENNHEAIITK